jgi:hypothetical protein
MDARKYEWPSEPAIVYLANPFAENVMVEVLDNIRRSLEGAPREMMIVLYYYPALEGVLDRSTSFRRLRTGFEHTIYRHATELVV